MGPVTHVSSVELGLVVSGATISSIPVQIYRQAERYAQEEQMVAVRDAADPDVVVVGFLRRIAKLEPIVRDRGQDAVCGQARHAGLRRLATLHLRGG
jgi:hypothetical protein